MAVRAKVAPDPIKEDLDPEKRLTSGESKATGLAPRAFRPARIQESAASIISI